MIANTAIAAFVICFSYGVFQNYRSKINEGEQQGKMVYISALYSTSEQHPYKDFNEKNDMTTEYSSITKKDLIKCLMSLSEDTKEAINYVFCEANLQDSCMGLQFYQFLFKPTDKGIVPADSHVDIFTDEQYINGEKIAKATPPYFEDPPSVGKGSENYFVLDALDTLNGKNTLTIEGEEYRIVGTADYTIDFIFVPITSLPDDTVFRCIKKCVEIQFKKDVTYSQYSDIQNAVNKYMGDTAEVEPIDRLQAAEIQYYKTIAAVTIIISILSAINLCVMFKYFLEREQQRNAIFRMCGCSKANCILMLICQTAILIIPVFGLIQWIFYKVVYNKLLTLYPFMEGCFSRQIYYAMIVGYSIICLFILLIMLLFSIGGKVDFTEEKI